MDSLVKKIKEKYELKGLPDTLVMSVLEEHVSKNRIKDLNSEKNKKLIIKSVRSELRRYVGQYASKSNIKNRQELLINNDIENLLKQHSSTRERLEDYPLLKEIIQKIKPKSILDLGCGINPIVLAEQGVAYHAYDVNHNDLVVVEQFFNLNKIEGDVHHIDITQVNVFPEVDLCLIFKVLDIIPAKIKNTKSILEKVKAKHFIISFATKTLTGKKMNSPYRRWFERILKDMNLVYQVKRTNQELFYIIKK